MNIPKISTIKEALDWLYLTVLTLIRTMPNPNLLINGELFVWGRGTSFTNPANAYTADRMKCNGTGTVSRATENGGMRITGSINLRYIMEDVDYYQIAGKKVTLSYSKDGEIISDTYTASSSTVVDIDLADCTIDWIKLEMGDKTTRFIPRIFAEVLALCQRYYYRISGTSTWYIFAFGRVGSDSLADFLIPLPQPLRVAPTLTYSNVSDFNVIVGNTVSSNVSVLSNNGSTVNSGVVRAATSGLTLGHGASLQSKSTIANAWLAFDAEV